MSVALGLTGSIGMGKTTAAGLFRARGIPVWDADAAVHRLYTPGGAAVAPLAALVPDALRDGGIDRAALRQAIAADPELLGRIEAIVHPRVAADRAAFRAAHAEAPLVVFDIPLLFETGAETGLDRVAVVSTDADTQRRRVLDRPGMTEADLAMILARQFPDAEKRARADFVIRSDTMATAEADVARILASVTEGLDA